MGSGNNFEDYFSHLKKISPLGRAYKSYFASPIIFLSARRFGKDIVEIGSGTGSGILGTFPKCVKGLEINALAVEYCQSIGLNAQLIEADAAFPMADGMHDCCVLDNVLEHINNPKHTIDECYRITKSGGGLVIVVPGLRGYESDSDHKIFYGYDELIKLDSRWQLVSIFSIPFFVTSKKLSSLIRQYCLIATYKKI